MKSYKDIKDVKNIKDVNDYNYEISPSNKISIKEKKGKRKTNLFNTYSSLITILIIAAFIFSITKGEMTNTSSINNDSFILDEDINLNDNKVVKELKLDKSEDKIKDDESVEIKEIKYSYPVKGDIITKFSPNELIYDQILDEYHTSNGITMKTANIDLLSMCDSKIIKIENNNSSKSIIQLMTTDNHIITIKGYFKNFIKKEGDIILKGSKICDINSSGENSYIEINIMYDNKYIDPLKIINS